MSCGRSRVLLLLAVALVGVVTVLAQPDPPKAEAALGCDVAAGGLGIASTAAEKLTGGAIGGGNPVADLCDKVTGAITSPVDSALKSVGDDVFKEMTKWVAQGAGWLMGQAVSAIDSSTTPHLRRAGFLSEYAKMSAIAVLLAVAALLATILQGIAQGSPGLMLRAVLVNAPLAFIGTSVAFVVVQMLVNITDSLCHTISAGTGEHGAQLFESALDGLGKIGGNLGEIGKGGPGAAYGHITGETQTPLFVGFLLAIVGAIAGFCVLVEFAFRDAAIYAVSLFMPFALYASISPRWQRTLRKYAEVLFAVIESKFVIVAIIALAAALVGKEESTVEVILVATVLLSLACFSPFFLFRIVAFSEGAVAASVARRSGPATVMGGATRTAYNARMLTAMAQAGGGGGGKGGSGVKLWSPSELAGNAPAAGPSENPAGATKGSGGGSSPTDRGGRPPSPGAGEGPARPGAGGPGAGKKGGDASGAGKGASTGGAGGAAPTAAAGPAGAAAAAGAEAGAAPKKAAEHLSDTGTARSAGKAAGGSGGGAPGGAGERAPRPDSRAGSGGDGGSGTGDSAGGAPPAGPSERPPRPPSRPPHPSEGSDPEEPS